MSLDLLPDLSGFVAQPTKPADLQELVPHTDPILREVIPEFDFSAPPEDPIKIARQVADAMIWYKGVGLSANQIGLRYRAFAMRTNPVIVCFNPRIVFAQPETKEMEEGCLSFPGIGVKVKRFDTIRVRYQEPNGNFVNKPFVGMTARIFQHETDHLNGILFTDELSRLNLERTLKKAKKRGFKQYSMHQFAKPEKVEEEAPAVLAPNPYVLDISAFNRK